MESNQIKGPLPIMIGITGHRNIDESSLPVLEKRTLEVFSNIKQQYVNSEIIVMSALAIGADTLCAEAAIEAGCKLVVPIPMELTEYRKDFSEEDAIRFDSIIKRADEVIVVSEDFSPDLSRDAYYVKLGEYLKENSHLLIALWDGDETRILPGGTSDVVRMAREKYDTGRKDPLSLAAAIPVLQITAHRQNELLSADSGDLYLYDLGEKANAIEKFAGLALFDRINAFNEESMKRTKLIEDSRFETAKSCIKDYDISNLKKGESLLSAYVAADVLSMHSQAKRNIAIRNISLIALGMVLSFLLYDEGESIAALLIYGVLMIISVTIYLNVRDKMWHEHYLLYRALAEILRIKLYMGIAGIDYKPHISNWRLDGRLLFVLNSVKNFSAPAKGKEGIEVIKECWVNDQLDYHNNSSGKKKKTQKMNDLLTKLLILVAMLFYVIVVLFEIFFAGTVDTVIIDFSLTSIPAAAALTIGGLLKIIMGTLFAGVAFLANYYGKQALPEKIDNNEKLYKLFSIAAQELEIHKDDVEYTREILLSLADAHIEEVVNWYVYNSKNAPELMVC